MIVINALMFEITRSLLWIMWTSQVKVIFDLCCDSHSKFYYYMFKS